MNKIIENLKEELFQKDRELNLYMIVDSAVNKMIDGHFESDDVDRYILYKDEEDKRDLELRAPHLVEFREKSIFTQRVFDEGYGNNWGCFIKSSHDMEILVEHFSSYTKIYSEAHEQDVYIRFYDPRAMSKYFSMFSKEEGIEFFSKIDAIYIEKVEELQVLLKYSLNKDEMIQREEISLEGEG